MVALAYMGPFPAPSGFHEVDPGATVDYFKELMGTGEQHHHHHSGLSKFLQVKLKDLESTATLMHRNPAAPTPPSSRSHQTMLPDLLAEFVSAKLVMRVVSTKVVLIVKPLPRTHLAQEDSAPLPPNYGLTLHTLVPAVAGLFTQPGLEHSLLAQLDLQELVEHLGSEVKKDKVDACFPYRTDYRIIIS